MFHIFYRTWYDAAGRPKAGKKQTLLHISTEKQAREVCKEWDDNNADKRRGRKAEFQKI